MKCQLMERKEARFYIYALLARRTDKNWRRWWSYRILSLSVQINVNQNRLDKYIELGLLLLLLPIVVAVII